MSTVTLLFSPSISYYITISFKETIFSPVRVELKITEHVCAFLLFSFS